MAAKKKAKKPQEWRGNLSLPCDKSDTDIMGEEFDVCVRVRMDGIYLQDGKYLGEYTVLGWAND